MYVEKKKALDQNTIDRLNQFNPVFQLFKAAHHLDKRLKDRGFYNETLDKLADKYIGAPENILSLSAPIIPLTLFAASGLGAAIPPTITVAGIAFNSMVGLANRSITTCRNGICGD